MKNIIIIGGASAIAWETAKKFVADGTNLFLVDRFAGRLEAVRQDLLARSKVKIGIMELDVNNFECHEEVFSRSDEFFGDADGILIAHGTLPEQLVAEHSREAILKEFSTNCTSVLSFLTIAADYFESRKNGCIAVISSVAGDRGRRSNYIYGSAKGAVSIFTDGLRNRLREYGVNVVNIKPGFVDTPMTAHLPKNFLFTKPAQVGEGIYEAMKAGKSVVYLPGYWRFIMMIVKHIPEFIFSKLKF